MSEKKFDYNGDSEANKKTLAVTGQSRSWCSLLFCSFFANEQKIHIANVETKPMSGECSLCVVNSTSEGLVKSKVVEDLTSKIIEEIR